MRFKYPLVFAILIMQLSFAWNERAHHITVLIAYDQLSVQQRQNMTDLLKHHPDYQTIWLPAYNKLKSELPLDVYLMMRASTWPDVIRKKNNLNHQYHKDPWHYITYKIDFDNGHDSSRVYGKNRETILTGIDFAQKMVNEKTQNKTIRAVYLAWLIHLIGDVHQPMHCGSLFNSDYPNGDRGGNDFFVMPKNKGIKLHTLWDNALGTGKKMNNLKSQATRIVTNHKKMLSEYDVNNFDAKAWSIESFEHAIKDAHQHGKLIGSKAKEGAVALPNNYTKILKNVAELRCYLAGVRLGNAFGVLMIN